MKVEARLLTNSVVRPHLRDGLENKYLLNEIRGIVIHSTGNTKKGAGIEAYFERFNNPEFFTQSKDYESYHYLVENDQVLCLIPEKEIAYHAGDKINPGMNMLKRFELLKGVKDAGSSVPNWYTLSICICINEDSDLSQTIDTTAEWIAKMLMDYKLKLSQVYRHYDITGRKDPGIFCPGGKAGMDVAWITFKRLIATHLG